MSETTLKARLVHPCKTDAEWASSNPVAKKGEIMISSDKSGMFKVGNGTSKWSDLQYNHVTWSNVEGKPSTFTPSSHTHDDRYYTETEINDKVTALNNSIATKVTEKTITEAVDLNTLTTTGVYHIKTSISSALHGPTTSQGTLYVDFSVGTPYQLFVPDANTLNWYKRSYNKTSKTWAGWITIYNSDTVYTHPSYTAYASGLYKITTNSLGHVTSATAVTKGDITALGIPGSNTDSKVLQTAVKASDYTNWRTVLWGSSNSSTEGFTPTTVTDQVFSSQTLTFQPSTGTLKANTFKGNLSGNATSASAVAWSGITGKPSTYAPSSHTHTKSQITDFPTLGTAASKNTRTLTSASHSSWANASTDQGYVPDMAFIAYWNGAFSSNGASNLAYCNRGAFGTIVTKNAGDYASAGHTHNYAGSSSVGGSANSAVKLDTTTAGSATQPVYFSGGKPVACTYTLGKSVPSNAVFTDTNTWRPLGTTADTACAGNDSRLSNSRPASDVYSWAKASTKPSYSWNEITGKPSSFTPSSHTHNYLPLSGGTVTGATAFNSGVTIKNAGLELYHSSTPFIDFHYANSTADYTSRIIENAKGVLNINGATFTDGGSVWCTSFSTDGGGTFGGDLSATRGLKLNHSGTSLYLYNDGGNFCMMHTGKDGNSTWPIIWNFAGDNLQTGNNFRVFKEGNGEAQIHANNSLRDVYLCASSSGRAGIYDTQAGWIVRSEADHTTSYIGECMVKWGKVTAKADSTSWLNGAQPGYAAFEAINTTAGALVPGMRIRTADGAWVLASYATDPGFRIYYANASRLNNNNQNSYDQIFTFGSSGTFYTKSVSQTSDERRKNIITNLSTLPQAHKDFFMKLNPFTFKWKDNNEDLLSHYGVGAQSVYQAALDCGFTDDDLGFIHKGKEYPGTSIPWSVSYTEFIPLNIAVTQDHETRIEKLERENEELKQQIKELKGLTA